MSLLVASAIYVAVAVLLCLAVAFEEEINATLHISYALLGALCLGLLICIALARASWQLVPLLP